MSEPNPLLALLRQCVVQINDEEGFKGSGFLVAPGEVVTCAHVVQEAGKVQVSGEGWVSSADVVQLAPKPDDPGTKSDFYPLPDLALLRVEEVAKGHPCAKLEAGEPITGSDPDYLYVHGYSESEYGPSDINASSASVEYKGPLQEVFKLGGDQVLRGYSGSPAMNYRTGSVVAVIDSTRDAETDLGGFGLPVALLFKAFPGLEERNTVWHREDARWQRAFELEQGLGRERASSTPLPLSAPLADLGDDISQSQLLQPRFGVVGLIGRERLQEDLMRWRESEDELGVVLIAGGGGFGKTRLALEECERARRSGWRAGLLVLDPTEPLDQALRRLTEWPERLFVAIDYAETRPSLVASLILRLTRRRDGPTVRLLLICRQLQTKRAAEELFAIGDARAEIIQVLSKAEPVRLDQHELDSHQLFEAGFRAFAKRLNVPFDSIPVPSLREDHYARPLFVLAAALLSAQDPDMDIDSMSQRDLMLELIDRHESQYWQRLDKELGLGLDATLQADAVAVATALTAVSEQEAVELIGLVPGLEETSSERRRAIATWLSRLYNDGRLDSAPAISPVEPDLLGEALVAREFQSNPGLIQASLEHASEPQLARLLGVLTKASEGNPELKELFRKEIDERLLDLVEQAASAKGDLEAELDLAVSTLKPLRGAMLAAAQAPQQLAAIGPAGITIARLAVSVHQAERERGNPEADVHLVSAWSNFSSILVAQGFVESALEPAQEALALCRELVGENRAHLSALAKVLQVVSNRLSLLERSAEALPPIEEAVECWRKLVDESPEQYKQSLAAALNTLGGALSQLAELERARAVLEESIRHHQVIAESSDSADDWENLAMALNSLSIILHELGENEEGLTKLEEALEIMRGISDGEIERLPALARILNNISSAYGEQGQSEKALETIEEAVKYRRTLIKVDSRHLAEFAGSLNNLSNRLDAVGREEEALAPIEEAVESYRALVRQNPSYYRPELADSLNNLSNRLDELGRSDDAVDPIEEAVELYRELVSRNEPRFLPDLAMALNNLGTVMIGLTRREEALAAVEEAVEYRRKLVARNRARYLPELASSLANLSTALSEAGQMEAAVDPIKEAVRYYRTLAEQRPARFREDLASALNNLSNRLDDVGRSDEALVAIEEAIEHRRKLVEENRARYLPGLATSLNNLAGVLAQHERESEALVAIEEAIEHRRLLAARNPARHLFDYAMSLQNMILICHTLGESERCRETIEAALEEHADISPAILQLTLAKWFAREDLTERAVQHAVEAMVRSRETGEGLSHGQARLLLRMLRLQDQAVFDTAWTGETEEDLPVWLRHCEDDEEMVQLVVDWIGCETWQNSRSFLEEYEELLSDSAEATLEHLLDDRREDPAVAQHLRILMAARESGVRVPYEQIELELEAAQRASVIGRWVPLDMEESRVFLAENADLLLDQRAQDHLLAIALKNPFETQLFFHIGILGLAIDRGPEWPYQQLEGGTAGERVAENSLTQNDLLNIARVSSAMEAENPDRQFGHALAALATGYLEEARQAIRRCRELLPSWNRGGYRQQLVELVESHPEARDQLLELHQILAAPDDGSP